MGNLLVTLDTLAPDRDFIVIDGDQYFMRSHEELSLSEATRLREWSRGIIEGAGAPEKGLLSRLARGKKPGLETFPDKVLGLVVIDLPAKVMRKLKTEQKYRIIQAFTLGASARKGREAPEEVTAPPTTDGSYLGSSDSSGALTPSG